MTHPSLDWIDRALDERRERDLFRTFTDIEGVAGPEVCIGGREYISFASNNYLGLTDDPRLKRAAIEAVERWGTGSGASRLISGNLSLHRQLERRIARLKATEDAIVFSTGFQANLGTITALAGPGDAVFSDALNHASIIDGCRLSGAKVRVYPHADVGGLQTMLAEHASSPRRLIVTDTVFSMDGDLAPLRELAALATETGSMLMVDEAHATGVLGANGGGLVEHLGLAGRVPVVMGTLSKSLGSLGGYVAGETRLIDYLRNCARSFVFTTALPPAAVAAAIAALDVIECEPQRRAHVLALTGRLAAGLRAAGFDVLPAEAAIIAVIIGPSDAALALAAGLREQGIFAPAIRPPTVPAGTARIRLAVTAAHTEAHIERALAAFVAAKAAVA